MLAYIHSYLGVLPLILHKKKLPLLPILHSFFTPAMMHSRAADDLVPLGLFLIEQRFFRLFRGKLGAVAWTTGGVAAHQAKPIQDRLGAVLRADRQRTVLVVSRNLHPQE